MLITQATQDRASDIHVEPTEHDLRIRFRIDGVLHEVMRSPRSIQAGVISRLKVMADINIAERRMPQDGRISMKVQGRGIDLRVATLPTVYGEKIVLRILDKGQALLRLEELGFLPETLARFENSYRKPYGTILVTGPTGSGKSTTLYAALNQVNDPDRNIITVEDPVEYRLPGINQVQVHNKAGLTFSSALRSILRADPDIILIGEIRDRETANIAIEAALTGHLVLSTLHTNDAVVDTSAPRRDGRRAVPRHERARLHRRPAPRRAGSATSARSPTNRPKPSSSPAGGRSRTPPAASGRRCSRRSAVRRAGAPASAVGSRCTRSCRSPKRSNG